MDNFRLSEVYDRIEIESVAENQRSNHGMDLFMTFSNLKCVFGSMKVNLAMMANVVTMIDMEDCVMRENRQMNGADIQEIKLLGVNQGSARRPTNRWLHNDYHRFTSVSAKRITRVMMTKCRRAFSRGTKWKRNGSNQTHFVREKSLNN